VQAAVSSPTGERGSHSLESRTATVCGDDPQVDPTLAVDEISSANVVDVLQRPSDAVGHLDLGSWRRQTVVDEDEA